MRKEIADLWVRELESGAWEQGKYFLEHSNTYCVFGILTNIAATQGICSHDGKNIGTFDGVMQLAPESVVQWAELKSNNGELSQYKYSLAELNDKGKSFKELAKIIKENYAKI